MNRWLQDQKHLQKTSFNVDIDSMTEEERCLYMKDMTLAAFAELGELLECFKWKPWSTSPHQIDRERCISEIVDVLHFCGNLLLAAGCDDDHLHTKYVKKMLANTERQRLGYDGTVCMEPVLDGLMLCPRPKGHDGRCEAPA